MPDLKGATRAQTLFLRAFAKNPYGPPPDQWPSPVVLRRWLKRPGFCGAMNSILRALRYQADFHLTAAAASGAHLLHGTVSGGQVDEARKHIESLIHLLRMAHVRHRFAEPLPKPERRDAGLINMLRAFHPSITIEAALASYDLMTNGWKKREKPGPGYDLWKRTGHPFTAPAWEGLPGDGNNDDDDNDNDGDGDGDDDDDDDHREHEPER